MLRFFIYPSSYSGSEITLSQEQFHYLSTVLRKKSGDLLQIVVERQLLIDARIVSLTTRILTIEVISQVSISSGRRRLVLVQGLPKQDKMGEIIRKCTEIGVDDVVPVMMARCVPQWDARQAEQRVERWSKIAHEASQQSHRISIPVIHPLMTLDEMMTQFSGADLRIVAWECEQEISLKSVLQNPIYANAHTIVVVIGPEGGLEFSEAELLRASGFVTVSISDTVLRVENAGFLTLGNIWYELS